jgi:hypothetical protein
LTRGNEGFHERIKLERIALDILERPTRALSSLRWKASHVDRLRRELECAESLIFRLLDVPSALICDATKLHALESARAAYTLQSEQHHGHSTNGSVADCLDLAQRAIMESLRENRVSRAILIEISEPPLGAAYWQGRW